MTKYGVLVVDDSAVMRKAISQLVEQHPDFYIIGKARNGVDALEKIERLQPAIVTIDLNMPQLNGLQMIEQIVEEQRAHIVIISNEVQQFERAIELGVNNFLLKTTLFDHQTVEVVENFHAQLMEIAACQSALLRRSEQPVLPVIIEGWQSDLELIIIGSSTGGPAALQKILTGLQKHFPIPILIVQHIPVGFTQSLANRFNQASALTVKEATHNEPLLPGTVYIAPAGIHTVVKRNSEQQLVTQQTDKSMAPSLYKPSVDTALLSVAPLLQNHLLTVILTGMGDDGLRGCREIKYFNGSVITQTEESCIVYGMPKVVEQAGLSDLQLAVDEVATYLMDHFTTKC